MLNIDYQKLAKEHFKFPYVKEQGFRLMRIAMSIAGKKIIPSTASAVMEELSLLAAFAI